MIKQAMITMYAIRRLVPALLLGLMLSFTAHAADTPGSQSAAPAFGPSDLDRAFPRSTLDIATPDARLHHFKSWLADDDQRRQRGLMFVRKLGDTDSMLFIYPQPMRVAMWMKNTYLPLDMLFVAPDGKVIKVVQNTEPLSLNTIESGGIVLGVVELPAGTAARLKMTRSKRHNSNYDSRKSRACSNLFIGLLGCPPWMRLAEARRAQRRRRGDKRDRSAARATSDQLFHRQRRSHQHRGWTEIDLQAGIRDQHAPEKQKDLPDPGAVAGTYRQREGQLQGRP
jgi:uncharacterized protein